MKLLARGLARGIAFGLAASTVEICAATSIRFIERRFGPGPLFFAQTAGPRDRARRAARPARRRRCCGCAAGAGSTSRRWRLAWWGLERWVALDSPVFRPLETAAPRGALVLARRSGLLLARRRPRLAWALGAVLLLAGASRRRASTCARPRPPLPPRGRAAARRSPARPTWCVVVLDTVRAGSVSSYGYERPTHAELDALAARRRAVPRRDLAFDLVAALARLALHRPLPLEPQRPLRAPLPRRPLPHPRRRSLEHAGYETFCLTANAWISDGLGLTRGFAWQDALAARAGRRRPRLQLHPPPARPPRAPGDATRAAAIVAGRFEEWARERPVPTRAARLRVPELHRGALPLPPAPPRGPATASPTLPYGELRSLSLDLARPAVRRPGRPAWRRRRAGARHVRRRRRLLEPAALARRRGAARPRHPRPHRARRARRPRRGARRARRLLRPRTRRSTRRPSACRSSCATRRASRRARASRRRSRPSASSRRCSTSPASQPPPTLQAGSLVPLAPRRDDDATPTRSSRSSIALARDRRDARVARPADEARPSATACCARGA